MQKKYLLLYTSESLPVRFFQIRQPFPCKQALVVAGLGGAGRKIEEIVPGLDGLHEQRLIELFLGTFLIERVGVVVEDFALEFWGELDHGAGLRGKRGLDALLGVIEDPKMKIRLSEKRVDGGIGKFGPEFFQNAPGLLEIL